MGKLKGFGIVFDNGKSVYNPSEVVSGRCIVDVGTEMKTKYIRIEIRGIAKVHWRESRQRNSNGRNQHYTKHYRAEEEYFVMIQVILGSENTDRREVLTPGHYEFPFSFRLPSGRLPSSFEGEHGNIRYCLKAEIEKRWGFNYKSKKPFTVLTPIDINWNDNLVPVQNSADKSLFCRSGHISIHAITDRTAYCPGESIAISVDVENLSRRRITPQMTLYQTQTFLAGGKSRFKNKKYAILRDLPIEPGSSIRRDARLLEIPAIPPSINNCGIIKVDYAVKVTLEIPVAIDLSMYLPVIIGTVPLSPVNYSRLSFPFQNVALGGGTEMYPPVSFHSDTDVVPSAPPPTYAECVEGPVYISDEDEENSAGGASFTPMYAYVHNYPGKNPNFAKSG